MSRQVFILKEPLKSFDHNFENESRGAYILDGGAAGSMGIPLAEFFLKKFSIVNKSNVSRFSKDAIEWLLKNPWQGNVRELENTIERVVVLSNSDTVQLQDLISFETCEQKKEILPDSNMKRWASTNCLEDLNGSQVITLNRLTNIYIKHVLAINRGAKDQTAKDLGIDRKTLYRRIHEMDREAALD